MSWQFPIHRWIGLKSKQKQQKNNNVIIAIKATNLAYSEVNELNTMYAMNAQTKKRDLQNCKIYEELWT